MSDKLQINMISVKIGHPESHLEAKLYKRGRKKAFFYLGSTLHKRRIRIIEGLIRKSVTVANRKYTLLNLGPGEGELERRILDLNIYKIGIDVSEEALNFGLKRKRFDKVIVADFERNIGKINTPKVDILIVSEVLEHIKHPGVFVKDKIKPLIKDGGIIIGSVPNMSQTHDIIGQIFGTGHCYQTARPLTDVESNHISFFSIKSLEEMLGFCGFREIKIIGNGVRIFRKGDVNSFVLGKLPFFRNFSDRLIFVSKK